MFSDDEIALNLAPNIAETHEPAQEKSTVGYKKWQLLFLLIIILSGLFFRSAGLFRDPLYHPDAAKQILAINNYMNGRYVWYSGSRFYDGYPLALNHVDEWLLRPAVAAARVTEGWLDPAKQHRAELTENIPGIHPQYNAAPPTPVLAHCGRVLRVLYGLGIMLMCLHVSRRINATDRPGPALWSVAMLALAPVSAVVTHAVAGDIGVTLFFALQLMAITRYAERDGKSLPALLAAGFCTGMSFACKYQGLLIGFVPGLLLILLYWPRADWKRFIGHGFVLVLGVLAGILAGMPQFLIDFDASWENMLINFAFIKDYQAEPEFLALPLFERLTQSLSVNVPLVLSGLGYLLCGLTALALFVACRRLRDKRLSEWDGRALLRPAIFCFPFFALAVSLLGKPHVQVFHFSYLVLPLTLSAGYLLSCCSSRWLQTLCSLLLLAVLGEQAWNSVHEHHFWRQDDTFVLIRRFDSMLVDEKSALLGEHRSVKNTTVEAPNMSAFRNRHVEAEVPDGDFWNSIERAPLPSIAFPQPYYWILANGPVFPRNDRAFHVLARTKERRSIVFAENSPETVYIGLSSGMFPTRVELDLGGKKITEKLPANTARVVEVSVDELRRPLSVRSSDPMQFSLAASCSPADCWIELLQTEKDRAAFDLFSGKPSAEHAKTLLSGLPEREETLEHLKHAFFLEGDAMNVRIEAGESLPLENYLALPAGVYELSCTIAAEPGSEAGLLLGDIYGDINSNAQSQLRFDLSDAQTLNRTVTFSKNMVPFETHLLLRCEQGAVRIGRWTLRPAAKAILTDLDTVAKGGTVPNWMKRLPPDTQSTPEGAAVEALFGGKLQLKSFWLPKSYSGPMLPFGIQLELANKPLRDLQELHCFLHLLNEEGEQVAACDFPMKRALNADQLQLELPLPDLQPGTYSAFFGIYNGRTTLRLKPKSQASVLSKRVAVGLVIKEAAP